MKVDLDSLDLRQLPIILRYNIFLSLILQYAPIAQLDRVLGYEPRGQEFESLRAHHVYKRVRLKLLSPFLLPVVINVPLRQH